MKKAKAKALRNYVRKLETELFRALKVDQPTTGRLVWTGHVHVLGCKVFRVVRTTTVGDARMLVVEQRTTDCLGADAWVRTEDPATSSIVLQAALYDSLPEFEEVPPAEPRAGA